jgi:hypothetical protein
MFTHFFYDITHFDSHFFTTVRDLFFKPGFLSKEYINGRRASYLHPVRMYVFTSAIFFLLFFSFFASGDSFNADLTKPVSEKQRADYITELQQKLKKDTGNSWLRQRLVFAKDTTHPLTAEDILKMEVGPGFNISFTNTNYNTFEEYDSAEKSLPLSKRDGWVLRKLVKIDIDLKRKFIENPREAAKKFVESILHRLPYMLLISLPFFALILKTVYIRRKKFYYADHGVFTIHLYIFTFLMLLLVFFLNALKTAAGWGFINIIVFILFLLLFFYLYKAMRYFYSQGRWKTFFKFLFVVFFSLVLMLILFILFMFFSAVTL